MIINQHRNKIRIILTKIKFGSIFLLFAFTLAGASACRHNRLKLNENALKQAIINQEKGKNAQVTGKENKAETSSRLLKGFKFKENRSVDPSHQPYEIDIAGNLDNIKEVRLSDIVSDVKYIPLEQIPDPSIPDNQKYKFHLTDNYIVAANIYGIQLYSIDGRFLKSIVKNEWTGAIIEADRVAFYTDYTLKGGGTDMRSRGDILYYNYSNTMTGEDYIMRFNCNSMQLPEENRSDPEFPRRITGLGEILLDLNHGKSEPPEPKSHQGIFGGSPDWIFYKMGYFMLDDNTYALPPDNENILTIRNIYGDTVSSFSRFERLKNYTKSLMRMTDEGVEYENNERLFIRPEFNDTVFMVMPPDHLLPVYVLKLGEYKVTKQEGVDPDYDLTGKIIPEGWAETRNYIFLTFTKDNYDSPNNRKNKNVKIYHALYSKQDRNLTIIEGDPCDYSSEILENDIDGGVPVWPSTYMVSNKGEIMISLKGKELKDRVKSSNFKTSAAPENRKNELRRLAESVSEYQDILMLVK